jgi:hypothetical protein
VKKLNNLTWTPAWTSVLGCIHGCLKYLHIAPDFSWLYGGTGHGFLINMSQDGSCPSGPTAWITSRFFELGKNLGYSIEGIFGDKRKPGWKETQEKAWDFTKTALDNGTPLFGWELAIPEFYVIEGYDEVGYYYNGPGSEMGPSPKPWMELGDSEIGMIEVYSVQPVQPAKDEEIVKEALSFAIAFNEGSPNWVLPEYRAGQKAYKAWIDAVESGRAILMGHAYNAAVWEECRRNGLAFLQEAKQRLAGQSNGAFNGAIRSYGEVAKQLKKITELYPFFENNREEEMGQNPKSEQAVEHLKTAKTAEAKGAKYLEEILEGLS